MIKQDYEQAIGAYRRVLELQGRNPGVMMFLAVAYLKDKRCDSAMEVLEQVIELQPDNARAYQYLGYCHLRQREQHEQPERKLAEVEKAIESYRKAVQIDAKDWMAHKGLGVAYMIKVLNEKDTRLKAVAVEHWKTSLELKPDQANSDKLRKLLEVYSR